MARSARQTKIIEIITNTEIEKQDELVSSLCDAGFEVTQATISRDIKELGLIKIVGEKKKYKYAFVGNDEPSCANKIANIVKESVLSVKTSLNLIVLKTVRGTVATICNFIDKLSIEHCMGCVYGEDTVMVIADSQENVSKISFRIKEVLGFN